MWAEISSAVLPELAGGLVGKLFGGKSKAQAQGVDYVKLREDAEAAGFNPLTALMSGGGAGYQREFSPDLSSGSFIAEAVGRGVDTWFNSPSNDTSAQQIRQSERVAGTLERAKSEALPRSFGYDLTEVEAFGADITSNSASVPPRGNPLYVANRERIPVVHPNGGTVQLDASVARRLGIERFDMLSVGDLEEIIGGAMAETDAITSAGAKLFTGGLATDMWDNFGLSESSATPPPLYRPKTKTVARAPNRAEAYKWARKNGW